MKKAKQLILAGVALCIGAAAALYWKMRRKQLVVDITGEVVTPKSETTEDIFRWEWKSALMDNARVFNGLYNGLWRVQNCSTKKPEKVLREWCQRTHYKFENQPVDILCQEHIIPLIETEDKEGLAQWANLLLDAAAAAGIAKEGATSLVLTESNADAYVEWDGNDLYPGDKIEIVTSAWYQDGKLLEQGQCKVIRTEEE